MTDNKLSQEDIKKHKTFVSDSLPAVEQLRGYLGPTGDKLDFTPTSLKVIDEFVSGYKESKRYDQHCTELPSDEKWLIVRIAYYAAEVLIRNMDGVWEIDRSRRSVAYKESVINLQGLGLQVEPLGLAFRLWKNNQSFYEWYQNISKYS